MPSKKKDVELIPSNVASGWKVKHDGKEGEKPGQGPDTYPVVDVNQAGPHLVIFKLPPDKPGEDPITFNKAEPMQIHPGTSSPTQTGMDAEFPDWEIFDGGKTLVVLDSNSKPGDYSYRVKADGYDQILDPIIKNGGGGIISPPPPPPSQPPYSFLEIGIVALALIVVLAIGYLWGKRSRQTG